MSLRRVLTTTFLLLLAVVGAILTGIGRIPGLAGWPAVLVASGGALSSTFFSPLSTWVNKAVSSRIDQNEALDSLRRNGSVILTTINDLDPIRDLGVHPSMHLGDSSALTPYITRSMDSILDDAMQQGGMIVVEGDSTAGKTRTAYEAICRAATTKNPPRVLIPKDGVALRELVEAGFNFQNLIICLDDLERFLYPEGVDDSLISVLLSSTNSELLVVATIRSRAKSALGINAARPDVHSFGFDARKIFNSATTIRLDKNLDGKELARAAKFRSDDRIAAALDSVGSVGFAEYLAAGPALFDRWEMGRQGANQVGAALVSAAVDYQRAGYLGPIPDSWLEVAYPSYLEVRTIVRIPATGLEDGYRWATEVVHGASSCLIPFADKKFVAFDYLVDRVQASTALEVEPGTGVLIGTAFESLKEIPDVIWHTLGEHVTTDSSYFLSCVAASSMSAHPGMSWSLKAAIEAGHVKTAALGNGDQLLALARSCMAVSACIPCQVALLGLDLRQLLDELLIIVRPMFDSLSGQPKSEREIEALNILAFIGFDEGKLNAETDLYQALSTFDVGDLRKLGTLYVRLGGEEVGQTWLQITDTMSAIRSDANTSKGQDAPAPG
jgi:hypothetical protein